MDAHERGSFGHPGSDSVRRDLVFFYIHRLPTSLWEPKSIARSNWSVLFFWHLSVLYLLLTEVGYVWPLHDLLTLFLIMQVRVTNIPLLLLFYIQLYILGSLELSADEVTLTSIIFQYGSFFALGGSNAISSVDLSNAYNGISGYNIVAVGVLTFVGNWAGPIWWASAMNSLLRASYFGKREIIERHAAILTLFVSSSVFSVMLACTLLRTHLFIWTVFSPKYLYSMAWSIGQHPIITVIIGGLSYYIE
jgi:ethanolaminephosphotransferase